MLAPLPGGASAPAREETPTVGAELARATNDAPGEGAGARDMMLNLSASEAHILLAILDEARKGQPFPIAVYGAKGQTAIAALSARLNASVDAASRGSK